MEDIENQILEIYSLNLHEENLVQQIKKQIRSGRHCTWVCMPSTKFEKWPVHAFLTQCFRLSTIGFRLTLLSRTASWHWPPADWVSVIAVSYLFLTPGFTPMQRPLESRGRGSFHSLVIYSIWFLAVDFVPLRPLAQRKHVNLSCTHLNILASLVRKWIPLLLHVPFLVLVYS